MFIYKLYILCIMKKCCICHKLIESNEESNFLFNKHSHKNCDENLNQKIDMNLKYL
jgi:hypothetical protein